MLMSFNEELVEEEVSKVSEWGVLRVVMYNNKYMQKKNALVPSLSYSTRLVSLSYSTRPS